MKFMKLAGAALALNFLSVVPVTTVRAGDTPATTRTASSGSVTIKVVDAQGNAVSGAKVQLIKPHKKGDATGEVNRPAPVAEGETDAQGTVTLTGVADGSYRAIAVLRGTGRGAAKVTVGDDATSPTVITFKAKQGKHAKANEDTPATQPAQ